MALAKRMVAGMIGLCLVFTVQGVPGPIRAGERNTLRLELEGDLGSMAVLVALFGGPQLQLNSSTPMLTPVVLEAPAAYKDRKEREEPRRKANWGVAILGLLMFAGSWTSTMAGALADGESYDEDDGWEEDYMLLGIPVVGPLLAVGDLEEELYPLAALGTASQVAGIAILIGGLIGSRHGGHRSAQISKVKVTPMAGPANGAALSVTW